VDLIVILEWIPGHHGIPGNEDSNKTGKEGINKFPSDHPFGIPFAVGKEVI
jgi:ribonuclease HI